MERVLQFVKQYAYHFALMMTVIPTQSGEPEFWNSSQGMDLQKAFRAPKMDAKLLDSKSLSILDTSLWSSRR